MPGKDEPTKPTPDEWHSERNEPVIPGYWGPNMLIYGDISRLLFRMHHNVAIHMDAHKRLMERLQSVFAHEQALVLELAKAIDETTSRSVGPSAGKGSSLAGTNLDRIFEHASKALQESGKMLTDIQLEALSLLQHYIEETSGSPPKPAPKTE